MSNIISFPTQPPHQGFHVSREDMIELTRHICRCNLAFDNKKIDEAYEEIYLARLALGKIMGISE